MQERAAAFHHLIRADDQRLRLAAADMLRLGGGEQQREAPGVDARLSLGGLVFQGALVNIGPLLAEDDAGPAQNLRPPQPLPVRSSCSLMMAAAVSSIERRVTSTIGQ
jgi:hypothetical protein